MKVKCQQIGDLEKNKNFRDARKKRVTMQGFADRSGADEEDEVFLGSLKNYSR